MVYTTTEWFFHNSSTALLLQKQVLWIPRHSRPLPLPCTTKRRSSRSRPLQDAQQRRRRRLHRRSTSSSTYHELQLLVSVPLLASTLPPNIKNMAASTAAMASRHPSSPVCLQHCFPRQTLRTSLSLSVSPLRPSLPLPSFLHLLATTTTKARRRSFAKQT